MGNLHADAEEELVLVFDAPNQVTAELVCSTLQAGGIRAVLRNPYAAPAAGWMTYLVIRCSPGVLVPACEADAARSLLAAQEPTEEELSAEVEANTMTLEEAEDQVK